MSGVRREASARPMLSGAGTEWLPPLGSVVAGAARAGRTTPGRPSASLRPPTPEIVIGLLLNSAWPRATGSRRVDAAVMIAVLVVVIVVVVAAAQIRPRVVEVEDHRRERRVRAVVAEVVVDAEVARRRSRCCRGRPWRRGDRACRRGCRESARTSASSSKSTMLRSCAAVRPGTIACAWPSVASLAWSARSNVDRAEALRRERSRHAVVAGVGRRCVSTSVSRPSHITVLRKNKFADGSGRRNIEMSAAVAWWYGSSTVGARTRRSPGSPMPTRIRPFVSSMLYAIRRFALVDTSAVGRVRAVVRAEDRVEAVACCRSDAGRSDGMIVQPSRPGDTSRSVRPFVPRLVKKSPVRSTEPSKLNVAA